MVTFTEEILAGKLYFLCSPTHFYVTKKIMKILLQKFEKLHWFITLINVKSKNCIRFLIKSSV